MKHVVGDVGRGMSHVRSVVGCDATNIDPCHRPWIEHRDVAGCSVEQSKLIHAQTVMDRTVGAVPAPRTSLPQMGILDGKNVLITGVLTDSSLAFGIAQLAQQEGANIILTGAGRGLSLTSRTARKFETEPEVLEFDVTDPEHVTTLRSHLESTWGRVDAALHAIGFAPEACLGDDFMAATWDDVKVALEISAYSYKTLAEVVTPLMAESGGSVVGLDFDATVSWPAYNWMGVAKAALESTNRYLAKTHGPNNIRFNLVAAGPIRTVAAKSIPAFAKFEDVWDDRAPLGWDVRDSSAIAKSTVAMMSDWFPATTGSMIHVDGGYNIMGA